jgi:hypothetical protein
MSDSFSLEIENLFSVLPYKTPTGAKPLPVLNAGANKKT